MKECTCKIKRIINIQVGPEYGAYREILVQNVWDGIVSALDSSVHWGSMEGVARGSSVAVIKL